MCRVVQNPCVKREIRIKTLATILLAGALSATPVFAGALPRTNAAAKKASAATAAPPGLEEAAWHSGCPYTGSHCTHTDIALPAVPETPDGPGNTAPNTIEASKSKLAEAISGAGWRSG
jgi:hypothetical protein